MIVIKAIIKKYESHLIFTALFTTVFLLIKAFFIYLLPFIIGISVAFLMHPVYAYMKNHLSFKSAFSATVISLFIFLIVILIVGFLVYLLISEIINLFSNYSDIIMKYLGNIDFIKAFSDIRLSGDLFSIISGTAMSVFKVIPVIITLVVISFAATVTFINSLSVVKKAIFSRLSNSGAEILDATISNAKSILQKFIRSYMVLYLITFVESVFVFWLVDVDYPLVFAFLAAVSDLLPVLGPGTVYIPIAVVRLLSGSFLSGISLIVLWLLISIIRQIIEPKIVSDTIKIHPLVILSALYFSIVSSNFWVLIYITLFAVVYKVLIESDILKPIFYFGKSS